MKPQPNLRDRRPFLFTRGRSPFYHLAYWNKQLRRRVQVSLGTTDFDAAKKLLAENEASPIFPRQKIRYKPEAMELVKDVPGTTATKQNRLLEMRARSVLASEPEKFALLGERRYMNVVITLGRVPNHENIKILAEKICTEKVLPKPALDLIAIARTGKAKPQPRRLDLGGAIIRAIRLHTKKFPASDESIALRLSALSFDYRDAAKREKKAAENRWGMIKYLLEGAGLEAPGQCDPGR